MRNIIALETANAGEQLYGRVTCNRPLGFYRHRYEHDIELYIREEVSECKKYPEYSAGSTNHRHIGKAMIIFHHATQCHVPAIDTVGICAPGGYQLVRRRQVVAAKKSAESL